MLASSSGFCQEYKLVKMGNQRFLEFTLTDLIRLFNMSELVWETEMINNGFEKLDESEGITIYISGEIGQQSLAVSRNIVGLLSVDWFNYAGKERMFGAIHSLLKGHYIETLSGIDYYAYDKYLVGIKLEESTDSIVEHIFIKFI